MGKNTYEPLWLPIATLTDIPFVSARLQKALQEGIAHGFPAKVTELI
jgi:hypothetical protein